MIRPDQRRLFDQLLEQVLAELPEHLHQLLEEIPLIVEDQPSQRIMDDMHLDPRRHDLCGLHWGIPLTMRSVGHSGTMPDRMMLFREPIMRLAGSQSRTVGKASPEELQRQIRITVLHEIGHHFGLDEDDLAALGYA